MTLWLSFAMIFTSAAFLFFPSLNYYFFQDDWFVLNWVSQSNLLELLRFRTDIIYWRPLSMPILFAAAKTLFGLDALKFHLLSFVIFVALVFSVYKLFLTLTKDRGLSSVVTFLYAVWPIHYAALSWFSTTSYIIAPLLMTLSFAMFVKFQDAQEKKFYGLSFVLFLLALASSEFGLVLAPLFLLYQLIFKKKVFLVSLAPFILISLAYLTLRFIIYPVPAKGEYEFFFNHQLLINFIWYFFWAVGLPESFKSLIFPSLPQQSVKIITQFWQITLPVLLFTLLCLWLLIKNLRIKIVLNNYLFGICWFIIGLTPVIFVAKHSSPGYLAFAGLGFLYLVAYLLKGSKAIVLAVLLILWFIISLYSLQFTRNTHWIRNEQAISRTYVEYTKDHVKNPPANSIFLLYRADLAFSQKHNFLLLDSEDTLRQSLNDQDAIQVIYQDTSLKSIFIDHGEEQIIPEETAVFEIYPRGNQ